MEKIEQSIAYMEEYMIRPIAHVRSDYNEKFGIPRQAGLVEELEQAIVIEPEFRNADALRGIEGFSRIWVIWGFSGNAMDMTAENLKWSPMVRPPRVGGKERKGVWASRSPYRPNSLGMSNVLLRRIIVGDRVVFDAEDPGYDPDPLKGIGETNDEIMLIVSGADMMNGTPVFDIKPYIAYSDAHPDASAGFTSGAKDTHLKVEFPEELLARIDESKRSGLMRVLELDPRGAYEKKDGYSYGMSFGSWDIKFTVERDIIRVTDLEVIETENG